MGTNAFDKFVARQQAKVAEEPDWTKTRDEWLATLHSLHASIIDYLTKYIENGSITYKFIEIPLTEEYIGSYFAKQMDITIGRQKVSLIPRGTLFIGCKGRVDVIGAAGQAQLLLINEKARTPADLIHVTATVHKKGETPAPPPPSPKREPVSWAWKIVTSTTPRRFVNLDKDSLFGLLMEVSNG
jgi:hypothetical protein